MTDLVVRRLRIDLETPFPAYWNGGDAFSSTFFNLETMSHLMTDTGSIEDLLPGDQMKVQSSTIALLRVVGLIERAPRSFAIITPPG